MRAGDTFLTGWANLRRRKGRTILTAAGVVIGVASLVLMISLGLGVQREVVRLLQTKDGLRTIHVSRVIADRERKKKTGPLAALQMGGQPAPLTEKDFADIAALPGVDLVVPDFDLILAARVELASGAENLPFVHVGGVHPREQDVFREALVHGRLWNAPDEKACLLPKEFGKPEELLGSKVVFSGGTETEEETLEARTFTCVGAFDPMTIGFRAPQVALSYERALELRDLTRGGVFLMVPYKKGTFPKATVRVADARQVDDVTKRLQNLDSSYQVFSLKDILKAVDVIFLVIEGFLACIGAIGLVVSLFGIANTMAMAVLERTREIGIMKALGARNRDIGRLFLAEAAGMGAAGGGIGLALAWLAGRLLGWIARGAFNLPEETSLFHVSIFLAAGSLIFSVGVSILAGYLPARRAVRMDPVAALRYE